MLDSTRREVLAFHHHPNSRSPKPHIHVRSSVLHELASAHVPSGIIRLAPVIRMLIEDLGVRPLRNDWRDVLASEGEAQ